jgi:hypothetical protein
MDIRLIPRNDRRAAASPDLISSRSVADRDPTAKIVKNRSGVAARLRSATATLRGQPNRTTV